MKTLFTFLLGCWILAGQAQTPGIGQIIMLHPSVGNTITLSEKQKFGLFPAIPDSTFETLQLVKYNDSTFSILIFTTDDNRTEQFISKSDYLKMYAKVESLQPAQAEVKKTTAGFGSKVLHALDRFGDAVGDYESKQKPSKKIQEKNRKYNTYPYDYHIHL